jgi:EpsI family protein
LLTPPDLAYAQVSPTLKKHFTLSQLLQSESPVAHPPARLREVKGRLIKPAIPFWQAAVLAAVSLWLYAPTLYHLVLQWWNDPNFSHGFFVPLFAAFVVWQERERLSQITPKPSWSGLGLVALALCVLMVGQLGAELFLARVSLLILVAGLVVLFLGWSFFRAILFPWAFLLFMIPIPKIIFDQITFPLQLLASQIAADGLRLFGVPVFLEGNVINLPAMPLEVAEACSGIRSLMSLATLAIIYGYLTERRIAVRWVLALASLPIAIAANSVRIIGTGLVVQYWDPEKAEGFYHTFSGWLIFVVSLLLLYLVHVLIRFVWPDRGPDPGPIYAARPVSIHSSEVGSSAPRFLLAASLVAAAAIFLSLYGYIEVVPVVASTQPLQAPPAPLGVGGNPGLVIDQPLPAKTSASTGAIPTRLPLESFPAQLGAWNGTDLPIDQRTRDVLGPGDFLSRLYVSNSDQDAADLFIAYFPSQRTGDTVHSPLHCLPGAGWRFVDSTRVTLSVSGHSPFPVNRVVVAKGESRQLVLYWYWAHDRGVASEYWAKYYLVKDSIKLHRSDGALVRIMTNIDPGETADAAYQRAVRFAGEIVPLLNVYIPR